MRLSIYNKILDTNDENSYVLCNLLRGSTFIIDKEVKGILENGDFEDLGSKKVKQFLDEGILVSDEVDELELARKAYENALHDWSIIHFTVATTYDCNLSCYYCYQSHQDFYAKSMSKETSEKTIKFIKNKVTENNSKALSITLYGGEPLLNFNEGLRIIKDLHKWAMKSGKGFFVSACTNGTLLTKDVVDAIKKYSLVHPVFPTFIVTLDGPREIHDKIKFYKDARGSFDDIIKNLKIVKKAKLPFVIKFNLDHQNYEYAKDLVDDLASMGFEGDRIVTTIMKDVFTKVSNPKAEFPDIRDTLNFIIELEKYAIKKGLRVFHEAIGYNGVNCKNLTDSAYIIDPYGDLYKCWTLMGQQEYKIGTIDENGQIQNYKPYLLSQRNIFAIPKCRKCPNLPICGGNCATFCYLTTGNPQSAICMPDSLVNHIVKVRARNNHPSKLSKLVY
jgi:uncharacterized protein